MSEAGTSGAVRDGAVRDGAVAGNAGAEASAAVRRAPAAHTDGSAPQTSHDAASRQVEGSPRGAGTPHDAASPRDTGTPHETGTLHDTGTPRVWDDGLIARRATGSGGAPDSGRAAAHRRTAGDRSEAVPPHTADRPGTPGHSAEPSARAGSDASRRRSYSRGLRVRLEAMRELVGLSRTRLDTETLAGAGRVLDEAAARHRLSLDHTVIALAGASGSGKSTLFNALAGAQLSEAGVRRPTTSAPVACTWSEGADGLLDRIGVLPRHRRRPHRLHDVALRGLVLLDLPDHDSAVAGRREQVDRLLGLVDAVVWVVDPEKYADAVLHERYLRPLADYAEVTYVVLNQTDRLPGDATDQVLDDLRRLLDEDGLALGEHGEPGATVLSLSALTGEGVPELRRRLGRFCQEGRAAERRLAADMDGATERLRPACLAEGRTGLTEHARASFEDRLADAVGAVAAGQAAEREWLRYAELACGAPWVRLRRRPGKGPSARSAREPRGTGTAPAGSAAPAAAVVAATAPRAGRTGATAEPGGQAGPGMGEHLPGTARAIVEQAVRAVVEDASAGLPNAWAQAVRDVAARGAEELPEALDETVALQAADSARPTGPGWWSVASALQGLLFVVQVIGALWLAWTVVRGPGDAWLLPALLMAFGVAGCPVLAWGCRAAASGPARRYGQETEWRLRSAAAACGRARVLEPVAAELLRYREVRDQYLVAAGGPSHTTLL
ncbi:GTPase [Streptomyces sp. NPDC002055]|uniref:GTPase n=1 Tax=Streptomyces sp. NPDC002055 TaxID=3154534 RepID=UPI00331E1B4C